MSSKSDLKWFLEQISENAKFVKFDYTSSETFSITLKCRVASNQTSDYYNQRTKQWLQKFSKFTSTNWITKQSFSNLTKLLLYRKLYVCHRPEFHRTRNKNYAKTKNQQCNAKIDFKVKYIKRGPMKRDPYLKEGLNLNIFIDFIHSHDVRTAVSYRELPTSDETDQIFYRYFSLGCSVGVAKYVHDLMLTNKYGEDSKESQSCYTNPNIPHIVYIHKKWKNGIRENISEIVADMKTKLTNDGGFLNFDENFTTAVVITPLMKRIIESFALDVAHIDRTNVSNGRVITILYVPTNAGLLPIAYIVQNQIDEFAFNVSIDSIKTYTRTHCSKQFEPKIVTINATEEQFKNMEATFFNCKMYKSFTAMCKEIWQWVCFEDNRISYKRRHEVMTSLQRLLRAQDLVIAERIYSELIDSDLVNWLPNLKELIENLWLLRDQWFDTEIRFQRKKLVDICLRTTAQFFLSRCRTFNVYLIVDVVTNIIENQWREIITALIMRKNLVPIFTKHLLPSTTILKKGSQMKPHRDELRFAVNSRKSIHLNVHNWRCDCLQGRKGQFCEHLTAVLSLHADVGKFDVSKEDRHILIELLDASPDDFKDYEMSESSDSDSQHLVIDESYTNSDDENQEMSSERSKTTDEEDDEEEEDEEMEDDEAGSFEEPTINENYYYMEKGADEKEIDNSNTAQNSNKSITDVPQSDCDENSTTETAEDIPAESPASITTYENALRKLNDEFKRLNKFFKENPNSSNMATMDRLAKELGKIRPIERVDLTNIYLKTNVNNNDIQ